jgi:hypothetical protein
MGKKSTIEREKYHGIAGISRGKFFVLLGASNTPERRLPAMPPSTVRGNPTGRGKERKKRKASAKIKGYSKCKVSTNFL